MKVYQKDHKHGTTHTLLVTPGHQDKDNKEWKHTDGSNRMFNVNFKNGVAEVPDNLGKFMLDQKQVEG